MKILKISGLVLLLSGCIYAGEVSVLPQRDAYIMDMKSYGIDYYGEKGPNLIKSENVVDTGFAPNTVLTAYKGHPMVDTRNYTRNYYSQEEIVANSNAYMTSGLSPVKFESKKKYEVLGQVKVGGILYGVVSTNDSKDVILVDNDGKVFNQIGSIKNDRLVLLDTKHHVNPESFRFEPVEKTKMLQSEITKGFEIRYEGIKLDRMVFNLMEFGAGSDEEGEFSRFNFPNRPGMVDIRGVKVKVFEATPDKIDYMILKD